MHSGTVYMPAGCSGSRDGRYEGAKEPPAAYFCRNPGFKSFEVSLGITNFLKRMCTDNQNKKIRFAQLGLKSRHRDGQGFCATMILENDLPKNL